MLAVVCRFLFGLSFLSVVGLSLSKQKIQELKPKGTPVPSDTFYLFAQFWKPEACYHQTSTNCQTIKQNVTIHGIWPNPYDTSQSYPSYCTDQKLTQSDVSSIESELNENWPSYEEDNYDFWSHEYEKHGTCSQWSTQPTDFLKQGLAWHAKYDIPQILQDNNIRLNTLVDKQTVIDVLTRNMFGGTVQLDCQYDTFMYMIDACFDWNGNNIDCPTPRSESCTGSQVMFSTD